MTAQDVVASSGSSTVEDAGAWRQPDTAVEPPQPQAREPAPESRPGVTTEKAALQKQAEGSEQPPEYAITVQQATPVSASRRDKEKAVELDPGRDLEKQVTSDLELPPEALDGGAAASRLKGVNAASAAVLSPINADTAGIPPNRDEDYDPDLVTWDGPNDPDNPKNWPLKLKWITSLSLSMFSLLSSMSSSGSAPALPTIEKELGMGHTLGIMSLSVFQIGMAFMPLFSAPLSEVYGRVRLLQATNLFYIVFNTLCGFADSPKQLLIYRFFAGIGGSGPQAIGSGVQGDLWRSHERGKAVAVYSVAPILGTVLGPICGGFLTQYANWEWLFYTISIFSGLVQVVGIFVFRETYGPVVLRRKAARLRKETGNPNLYTIYDNRSLRKMLPENLIRPFRLLGTQPIIQILALYVGYINGLLYLLVATFPSVWSDVYHESVAIGSLNYISVFLGILIFVQVGVRYADKFYKKIRAKHDDIGVPEYRLPTLAAGSVAIPIGIFWYGWSAREDVHWIMPNIGAAIFAGGTILQFVSITSYLVDAYTQFAASASASVGVLRNLLGFVVPLIAPSLYGSSLGFQWGNSLLGFIAIVIGIPCPILLWFFGAELRRRSPYAVTDRASNQ